MSARALRVLLVDDEAMARTRLRRMLEGEHGVQIVGECSDGREAASTLSVMKPDVVFLDIQMPGLDGFGALHLASSSWRPQVVFVTAFAVHAVDAFEHGAVDYLLKPYSRERLRLSLDRCSEACEERTSPSQDTYPERLSVPLGHRLRMVPVRSIDCVVAQSNYVELHVGAERVTLRETMAAMESLLDPRQFARIHRSRIVRIDAVTDIETLESGQYLFRLASGTRLTSGPGYRDRVRQAFRLRAR